MKLVMRFTATAMLPNWLKIVSVFAFCLLFRLLPFRPPNVEPILAAQMPFARRFGTRTGFLFGALSILIYDILTGTLGPWTVLTASAYGLLGLGAGWYLKRRNGKKHFVYFAIAGTLFYDAVTGLTVGPLFFGQPFLAALLGQIPFTLMHLAGNTMFAVLLSPFIERWFVMESYMHPRVFVLPEILNPIRQLAD